MGFPCKDRSGSCKVAHAFRRSRGAGVIAIAASSVLFAGMAALVKLLSAEYDGIFVSLGRFVVGAAHRIGYDRRHGRRFRRPRSQGRSLAGYLRLGRHDPLFRIDPALRRRQGLGTQHDLSALFDPPGRALLRGAAGQAGMVGAFVCFAGVAAIFWDSGLAEPPWRLHRTSLRLHRRDSIQYTKRARVNNGAEIVYLSVCVSGILATFWTAPRGPLPRPPLGPVLLASAVLGYVGQIALTWGVKFMDASEAGIISFLKIPVAIVLGLFLGEGLSLRFARVRSSSSPGSRLPSWVGAGTRPPSAPIKALVCSTI